MVEDDQAMRCLATGHRAGPARPCPKIDGVRRSRCLACGHALVRSSITRRWVLSAYLG